MELLINSLREFCLSQGNEKTYWVGYSGGLDSHVLLHVLARLRSELSLKIKAVYINHGLSPFAGNWSRHCEAICRDLKIDFMSHAVSVTSKNIEENARAQRYGIFSALLSHQDLLLTAHHQDDQAETVLLQLLRGAGPKGLSAMPTIKPFAAGYHARPLLSFSRDMLQQYAEATCLQWIDDESNSDTAFTRNFLRHDVLSLLKKRWPTVAATLTRVADNCAQTQQLLDEYIAHELKSMWGSIVGTLSVEKLKNLDVLRQRQILRAWLQHHQFPLPTAIKLQQIQRDMLGARRDKSPHVFWQDVELRRYRDDLYALPRQVQHDISAVLSWDVSQSLTIPCVGTLTSAVVEGQGLRADITNVSVRFRQQGEVLQLVGRECRHSLKKLFQEWGIPPWLRDKIPLIYVENKLAAVAGFAVSQEFAACPQKLGRIFNMVLES